MDMYQKSGRTKSDCYCHNCEKNFIAVIDCDIDGNHPVECPSCGHIHYRKVENGFVTSRRYNSNNDVIPTPRAIRDMWKSNTVPMETATTKHFLREKWINRSDSNY